MRLASLPLCLLLTLLAGIIVTTAVSTASQVISTTPDFTMSANPDTLSIPAGSSGTSTITLVSIDGFNGSVSLSAPSPLCPSPQCTTWEISPSNVIVAPNSTATATLTIFGGGEGAAGNITVYGNGGGLSHSVSVAFKIVSSGGTPDFTMSGVPPEETILKATLTEWERPPPFPYTVMLPAAPSPPPKIVRVAVAVELGATITLDGLISHVVH